MSRRSICWAAATSADFVGADSIRPGFHAVVGVCKCTPPFSFVLPKENAPCTVEKKSALAPACGVSWGTPPGAHTRVKPPQVWQSPKVLSPGAGGVPCLSAAEATRTRTANFGEVRDAPCFSIAAALWQFGKVFASSVAGTSAHNRVRQQKEKQFHSVLHPGFPPWSQARQGSSSP